MLYREIKNCCFIWVGKFASRVRGRAHIRGVREYAAEENICMNGSNRKMEKTA
jgi:hypothetical protein